MTLRDWFHVAVWLVVIALCWKQFEKDCKLEVDRRLDGGVVQRSEGGMPEIAPTTSVEGEGGGY